MPARPAARPVRAVSHRAGGNQGSVMMARGCPGRPLIDASVAQRPGRRGGPMDVTRGPVLLVTPRWSRDGGVATHVTASAAALARSGIPVHVVAVRAETRHRCRGSDRPHARRSP